MGIHKKQNPKDTSTYQAQIVAIESEMASLSAQENVEFKANGLSAEYYAIERQYDQKWDEKTELEGKSFRAKTKSSNAHIFLFLGAGAVFLISVSGSISLYVIAYRRNLLAFGVQQVMPIAQEGMETMAPTIGKTLEEASKGITKGIRKGIKETKDEEE